jgi:hypothetical protein
MRTNRSGESALLLLDVVDLLAVQKIEYAVIGALAASVHGAVRASMDADVVLSIGMGEAEDLDRACKTAGFLTALSLLPHRGRRRIVSTENRRWARSFRRDSRRATATSP